MVAQTHVQTGWIQQFWVERNDHVAFAATSLDLPVTQNCHASNAKINASWNSLAHQDDPASLWPIGLPTLMEGSLSDSDVAA